MYTRLDHPDPGAARARAVDHLFITRMFITRALAVAVACLLVLAAAGCGEDTGADDRVATGEVATSTPASAMGNFGDLDLNDDTRLANDEWRTWWHDRGVFARWDTDHDNGLTDDELGMGLFDVWDRNESGLTEAEWNAGTRAWGGPNTSVGTYDEWDRNGDKRIDENEFRQGVGDRDFFDAWDTNNDDRYGEDELVDGFFGVFDTNDDNGIDDAEWNAGNEDFDWGGL